MPASSVTASKTPSNIPSLRPPSDRSKRAATEQAASALSLCFFAAVCSSRASSFTFIGPCFISSPSVPRRRPCLASSAARIQHRQDEILLVFRKRDIGDRDFFLVPFLRQLDPKVSIDNPPGVLVHEDRGHPSDFLQESLDRRLLIRRMDPTAFRVRQQFRRIHHPVSDDPIPQSAGDLFHVSLRRRFFRHSPADSDRSSSCWRLTRASISSRRK